MSDEDRYYGGGPYRRQNRYHSNDYDGYIRNRDDCKPITSRIGDGRRARIAVETGGPYAFAREDEKKYELERRRRQLEMRREKAEMDVNRRDARPSPRITKQRPDPAYYRSDTRPFTDVEEIQEHYPAVEPRIGRTYSGSSFDVRLEADDVEQDYDFKLPIKPQAVTYEYVENVSFPLDAADSNEGPGKNSQAYKPKFSGPVTELIISKSRWLGSAYDRGDLSAEISVSFTADKQSEQPREPLIKWYHLERPVMSLEEFISAAQSVLQVTEQKRRDVNRLLRDVQRKFEKQRQHGRDLEPNCLSDVFVGENTGKQTDSVVFLSFPYFCLEPYNNAQFKSLTQGTPMHPLRPLLQAHFHSTSQKRELAQAVTTFPDTGDGNCVQLSQMWCLLVDGDTMLTCARPSHDSLSSETITKSETSSRDDARDIKVSFGNDRGWLIPVDDETSWPAFLSVFGESIASLEVDGVTTGFEVNGTPVNAEQWSFLVGAAQTSSIGLDLQQMALPQRGKVNMKGVLPVRNDQTEGIPASVPGNGLTTGVTAEEYSATSTANGPAMESIEPSNVTEDDDALQIFKYTSEPTLESLADTLHFTLQNNTRKTEKRAYDRTGETKAHGIIALLQKYDDPFEVPKMELTRTAIYLFRFFWPFHMDHPVTKKYWSAVEKTLAHNSETYRQADVDDFVLTLADDVVPVMDSFAREFSGSRKDLESLPDAFSKAFLHLIMVFILLSQTWERQGFGVNSSTVRAHVKGLKEELNNGKREITARLKAQTPALEDLEICSPASLLTLVLNQLSQDVMHGKPNVASTYSEFFFQLDFRITEDPTPRSHQESLRFFLQEIEAILSTLQYQLSVLEALEQSLKEQSIAASSSSAGDGSRNDNILQYALGESRQQIVLDTCKSRIATRIDEFRGLQQRAQDLGEWHRNEMETNRDRQENAIMVFTIVTIIFLPLSFVTSFFGMNTADVRNMQYGQWAYWAAGVPLTLLVVIGSLWWAGEFEGFGGWVERVLSRASSASAYGRGGGGWRRIPEPVGYGRDSWTEGDEEARRLAANDRGRYQRVEWVQPGPRRRRTTYPARRYR